MSQVVPGSAPESRLQKLVKSLSPIMGAIIGIVVLILFALAIYSTLKQVTEPPVAASDTNDAYSPFDRAVQVVGLVSPVLTIVLGFYFGAKAAEGAGTAAAAVAQGQTQSAQLDAAQLRDIIAELQRDGPTDMVNRLLAQKQLTTAPPAGNTDPPAGSAATDPPSDDPPANKP